MGYAIVAAKSSFATSFAQEHRTFATSFAQEQDAANLDCLPLEVAFLAFIPLFVPAGPSAHAPAASLLVQKTSAIPAEVAASAPINKCASINP
ncbi:hypothetical protein MHB48_00790 [Psychrobacillus sp. FSL H8-0483]|uniref:hypothetical protein n=1 Tax=Psychrobacillus sp. FSL H8-0483 TaxID=2921389 RepID=UPI00315B1AE9